MRPQPVIDLFLYVATPCILALRAKSYRALVRNVVVLCLAAVVPQILVDRAMEITIPGAGYLLVGIPALVIATICFLARGFVERRLARHATKNA
jgi:hypothetical protein